MKKGGQGGLRQHENGGEERKRRVEEHMMANTGLPMSCFQFVGGIQIGKNE